MDNISRESDVEGYVICVNVDKVVLKEKNISLCFRGSFWVILVNYKVEFYFYWIIVIIVIIVIIIIVSVFNFIYFDILCLW